MSTIRHLIAIIITLTAGLLVPASAAWAMVPNPDPASSGSSTTQFGVPSAAGGLSTWQVTAIAAVCTALAVLATLALSRFLRAYRHGPRHTAGA